MRSFAAVIFRKIASKTRKNEKNENVDLFLSLPKDQAAVIRQKLLEGLVDENDRAVRNKVSDAVAELARQYSEGGAFNGWNQSYCARICGRRRWRSTGEMWAELLQALFQLSMAPDAGKRETAFRVFTTTPGIIEKQHEEAVATAFTRGFKDDSISVSFPLTLQLCQRL